MADKMDIVDELLDLIENLDSPIMDEASDRDIELMAYIPMLRSAIEEVERLRHELDQRTDPELARALNNLAATYDGSMYLVNAAADLRAAARLLGGDR